LGILPGLPFFRRAILGLLALFAALALAARLRGALAAVGIAGSLGLVARGPARLGLHAAEQVLHGVLEFCHEAGIITCRAGRGAFFGLLAGLIL